MAKNTSRRSKKKSKPKGPITASIEFIQNMGSPKNREQRRKILAWSLIFFSIIAIVACISHYFTGSIDQSAVEAGTGEKAIVTNWLGRLGAWMAYLIISRGFGIFGFIPLLYGLAWGFVLLEDEEEFYQYLIRLFKYVFFITLFGSIFLSYVGLLSHANSSNLGGGIGDAINNYLSSNIGMVGVAFLILFVLILFVVLNFNAEIRASRLIQNVKNTRIPAIKEAIKSTGKSKVAKNIKATSSAIKKKEEEKQESNPESQPPAIIQAQPDPNPQLNIQPNPQTTKPDLGEEIKFEVIESKTKPKNKPQNKEDLELTIVEAEEDKSIEIKEYEQLGTDNVGKVVGSDVVEKIIPQEDQELANPDEIFEAEDFDPKLELSDYQIPPFELLEDHGAGKDRVISYEELKENKNKIVKTLEDYGIKITDIQATIGPTVTLYEIVPAPGVRISKIKNLEDDIALSLAALGIRIIAPIPGKGTIGIEVPNSKSEIVSLRSVLTTEKFFTTKAHLPIAIGRTIANKVFIADLHKMPHLLIAGATGQGKSVGLNTIIASLLYKKHPAEVKFILIDPKKVEMSLYQTLTYHFLAMLPDQEEPIITDVREAVNVLKSLCIEMDNRYDLLKKARVRNIQEYNGKFTGRKLSPRKRHRFLPYIVLMIDELADMMMTAGKEVEMPIARLAQLARAVGIHLVVATQRPSVNVITGIIKANFPARMSYRVTSKVDSRTILDANGADQLIGRGDLLLSTGSELIRIQNAFIDTPEVERMVNHISDQRGFVEPYYLPELPSEDGGGSDDDEDFERDSRFDEAARLIVKYQIGSASLIQRKMKLGYNRAGRIIDQLERAKIVGPHSGSKARDVLITDEAELERYLNKL
ncbi:MAG: DNA translocase FtsK [Bacteroidia bacterium]|nr:DNA translocase FtsK [Bacteroidia bacterium]